MSEQILQVDIDKSRWLRRLLPRSFLGSVGLLIAAMCSASAAQDAKCRVEPFRGATSPRGAVANMRIVNDGASCGIVNYGVPANRTNPANSGRVTKEASHGAASFVAPNASYTPEAGFKGSDEFEYEAYAQDGRHVQLRLKVLVKVTVSAP